MALLGMGANVHCNGYLSGYNSTRDFIFGSEDSTWTSSNGTGKLKSDCYHNGSLPIPLPGHLLGYDRELLKRTILKHEAIFRDQIHELHRLYRKQREIMDELRRNESYKHNLRIEISWSSSSLSHVSSKIAPKVYCSSKLPWETDESSDLIAKGIQLPLGSIQENSRQVAPSAPIPFEGFLEHSQTSKPNFRKVANKILDLELPADEYIDIEEGKSLEDERVSKVAGLSAYTLNEISQVEHNNDEKPYGAISNQLADLNEPFELEDEASVKSCNLVADTHLSYNPLYKLSGRTNLGSQQNILVFSDDRPLEQEKKHERLSFTNNAGQSGSGLGSFSKPVDTEKLFISSESSINRLERLKDLQYFHSVNHINEGSWSGKNIISGESSAATQGPTINGLLLRPGIAQLVSDDVEDPKSTNLNVMPSLCSETTVFERTNVNDKKNEYRDSRQRLPWLKEKPIPERRPNEEAKASNQMEPALLKHYLGGIHGSELKKTEESELCSEKKILLFHMNRKPYSSQASPSKVCLNQSNSQKFEEIERGCKIDVNIPCNPPNWEEQLPDGEHYKKNEIEKKNKCLAGIIDLNSCMNEDDDMPIDVDFKTPESPENQECSPPRGKSNEKQLKMPYQLAGKDDETSIAAESLVSISAIVPENSLHMTLYTPSEPSVSSPLNWFAGIVSMIMDYPENDAEVDCNVKIKDDLLLPAGIDYFEAMTLKLTETENLDCCCNKISSQNEKDESTSPSQPRKGRTKRGRHHKQKDFQSEILPSLASLSRYEVTEDLQTIGSLIEASGTQLETGSLRSGGRNVSARGRKRSHASASNTTGTLLKHLACNAELGTEKRGLTIDWEKICRKPRGKRYPTTNPSSSQVKHLNDSKTVYRFLKRF